MADFLTLCTDVIFAVGAIIAMLMLLVALVWALLYICAEFSKWCHEAMKKQQKRGTGG